MTEDAVETDTVQSEEWPELDTLAASVKTLILHKADGFVPHRTVDARLINACPTLTFLDLSRCGLERLGVAKCGLRGLQGLKDLSLGHNRLGPLLLPSGALQGLVSLRSLDLSSNALAYLPSALLSLESLESLDASSNALTALSMVELAGLTRLRSANMAGNRIASLAPADHCLRGLNLAGNMLSSLDGLRGSTELTELDVSRNAVAALPEEGILALCPKLKTASLSGNPFDDRKLLRAAEQGGKALFDAMRSGKSKRQSKREQLALKPPPERMYMETIYSCAGDSPTPTPTSTPATTPITTTKKGKNKKSNEEGPSAAKAISAPRGQRLLILASRGAIVVRPHVFACVLHVVLRSTTRRPPHVFAFASAASAHFRPTERRAFEGAVGLAEAFNRNGVVEGTAAGGGENEGVAFGAARRACDRFNAFIALQTKLHATIGDKRRLGTMGTHDASAVKWPLHFVVDNGTLEFSPLASGWMEAKGRRSIGAYCADVLAAPSSAADAHLKAHAKRLLRDAEHCALLDAVGTVLSVPPLSNGWKSRCSPDTGPALLLEASSSTADGPPACRAMLLELIKDIIADVEEEPDSRCVVLVQPVDVVCEWDHSLVRQTFPEVADFGQLPNLPPRQDNADSDVGGSSGVRDDDKESGDDCDESPDFVSPERHMMNVTPIGYDYD